ncbi:hypothetical protein [Limnochorda pilosa]|uniref:Uncharacterized protein n=1 Tax=Limnochorda pilosa TaxID=1555112 RepID=A0A0K2SIV1_LIMPI|nr:hypothetical protein [Limnochorda pilosa]BAS26754.1 hypothetical protein LIP_0897 [Limnochorda pilosa]
MSTDEPEIVTSSQENVESNERSSEKTRKRRRRRPFPSMTFREALQLADAIQEHASGARVRRLTLFDAMGRSAESSASRDLVTASGQYGITKGGYNAEYLELTPLGTQATSPESSERERAHARMQLAIAKIQPFNALYEAFKNSRMPSAEVMRDKLREIGIDEEYLSEAVDAFILNGQYTGIITEIAGAERIVSFDQALEGKSSEKSSKAAILTASESPMISEEAPRPGERPEWHTTCFYITPIGTEGSEERLHSDLFLGSIIEPALAELGLNVVRADQIEKPGMITRQIIEYILKSRLVIADLSFHNPNVFYELSLRHACRLPTVQVVRKSDRIPFDIDQFRTVQVDTSSIYTLVPKLESYRAAVANQIRMALENPDLVDSPISVYYPNLRVVF